MESRPGESHDGSSLMGPQRAEAQRNGASPGWVRGMAMSLRRFRPINGQQQAMAGESLRFRQRALTSLSLHPSVIKTFSILKKVRIKFYSARKRQDIEYSRWR